MSPIVEIAQTIRTTSPVRFLCRQLSACQRNETQPREGTAPSTSS
jgi:hypothetical protein